MRSLVVAEVADWEIQPYNSPFRETYTGLESRNY